MPQDIQKVVHVSQLATSTRFLALQLSAAVGEMLSTQTSLASLVATGRTLHEAFPSGFGEVSQKPAAATFGEALNIVQAREEFKRKKDGGKSKSKSKTATPLPETSNGSGSLATPEHSAFWLFVEASLAQIILLICEMSVC